MLTTKTILGAGWMVSSRLAGRLIDIVTLIVLARSLSPADFGLTALAVSLTAVVDTVFEVPLIQAMTRLKQVAKSHLDTAFTLGVLRGVLFSVVILAAAWPFAVVYDDHRLTALVATLSIGPISRGLYSPAMVYFVRNLSFRQAFVAESVGKVLAACCAIGLVYVGAGYWAIALNNVIAPLVTLVISYSLAPYRPKLSLQHYSEFSAFLGWFSGAQVVSAVSWQYDRALLGYFIPKSDLGQFTMASDLSVLPTQSIIGPAMQPIMAAFASINDDRDRLQSAYLKASQFTMLLAVPACVGMSLSADLIVGILLGAKWTIAATYLKWIALTVILIAYYQTTHALALALNRPNAIFRLSLIEVCSRVAFVSLGLYFFSLMGVIGARGAASVVLFVCSMVYVRSLIGLSIASQLGNLWKVVVASSVMALCVLLMREGLATRHPNPIIELGLVAGAGAVIYAACLHMLGLRFTGYLRFNLHRQSKLSESDVA